MILCENCGENINENLYSCLDCGNAICDVCSIVCKKCHEYFCEACYRDHKNQCD